MRKIIIAVILFCTAAIFPVLCQESVREEVKVVNVEVPVRVFYKGQPIDNLTIDDFKLYEDKKLQKISSFNILRKRIKTPDSGTSKPRYFVLVFRVYNFNRQFEEGLKQIFDNILNQNDNIFILANDKSMLFDNLANKEEVFSRVCDFLSDQGHSARGQLISYLKRIEQEVDMNSFRYTLRNPNFIAVQDFLKKYLRVWKDYKQKYLMPNLDRYYYFARQLEGIKKEKWVINFYQMEMIPNIIMNGEIKRELNKFINDLLASTEAEYVSYGRVLNTLTNEINEQLNIALDFPVEDIRKLFYKVDATFFSVFMRTTIGVESQDHESRKIVADMENCLSDITRSAGGILVSTNDLKAAIDEIGEMENVCYMLTYAPENLEKPGKIMIKVGNRKYKVFYDDNMRTDYIKDYLDKKVEHPQVPSIAIKQLDFSDKKLSLTIENFLIKEVEKGPIGKIGIHICIKTSNGEKIFDKGNMLSPQKETVIISIPFKNLRKGKYNIIVDAKDFLTEKTDQKNLSTEVGGRK